MTRHERDALCEPAMSERNSRGRRGAECRRDAGNADVGNVVPAEDLDLLATAAEDERISTFKTRYAQSLASVAHEQFVYAVLDRVVAGFFSHENAFGVAA